MSRIKMNKDDRRQQLLDAAVEVARGNHKLPGLTHEKVAKMVGCSKALVFVYFGTIEQLRESVVSEALSNDIDSILTSAILMQVPGSEKISTERKQSLLLSEFL